MGDKYERMRPKDPRAGGKQVGDRWEMDGKQMGDKYESMRPKDPRAGGKQVGDRWGDKWETSMNACGPRIPEQVGNKWETDGRQMGDKYERMRRANGRQV